MEPLLSKFRVDSDGSTSAGIKQELEIAIESQRVPHARRALIGLQYHEAIASSVSEVDNDPRRALHLYVKKIARVGAKLEAAYEEEDEDDGEAHWQWRHWCRRSVPIVADDLEAYRLYASKLSRYREKRAEQEELVEARRKGLDEEENARQNQQVVAQTNRIPRHSNRPMGSLVTDSTPLQDPKTPKTKGLQLPFETLSSTLQELNPLKGQIAMFGFPHVSSSAVFSKFRLENQIKPDHVQSMPMTSRLGPSPFGALKGSAAQATLGAADFSTNRLHLKSSIAKRTASEAKLDAIDDPEAGDGERAKKVRR